LVQRVDPHELQTCAAVDVGLRDLRECGLHRPFGVRVAVVARVAEQRAAAAEQGEVDAPRIHPHAIDPLRGPQGGKDLGVQTEDVPVQGVERPHRAVGEAVDDVERQPLAVERAEHAPAAFGAEVDREQFAGGGHGRYGTRRGRLNKRVSNIC
jgi:hypothetical protein